MERPTAAKVPVGRLRPGSFKSPDMLTPWVKPVTAGKNMAKITQKPGPPEGADQLAANRLPSQRPMPPMKKDARAAPRIAMTTYWNRVAQSAPNQAKINRNAIAAAAMIWGI